MADLHGFPENEEAAVRWTEQHAPDAVVLAGDLLRPIPGPETVEERFHEGARHLAQSLDPISCPVYYIMGNDDLVEWDPHQERFRSIHGRRLEQDGWAFVGYQYSLPFIGGVFEKEEAEIAGDLAAFRHLVDPRTVLVTHAPAHGVHEIESPWPAGSTSIAELIGERRPRIHVHGHIHRRFGRTGIHFNVAAGRVPRAMLIDLESLDHEELR
jgi:Icc-related predicted phosphoesterase